MLRRLHARERSDIARVFPFPSGAEEARQAFVLFGEVRHPELVEAAIDGAVQPVSERLQPSPETRQAYVELVSKIDKDSAFRTAARWEEPEAVVGDDEVEMLVMKKAGKPFVVADREAYESGERAQYSPSLRG